MQDGGIGKGPADEWIPPRTSADISLMKIDEITHAVCYEKKNLASMSEKRKFRISILPEPLTSSKSLKHSSPMDIDPDLSILAKSGSAKIERNAMRIIENTVIFHEFQKKVDAKTQTE